MQTPIDRYMATNTRTHARDGVTRDIAFNRKSFGPDQPQNPDQGKIYVGLDGLDVRLEQDFEDDDLRHLLAYTINATKGVDPNTPLPEGDWEEMLKGGLQTALEDFRVAFSIFGMSRTGTHQIVRTRLAAFHQQSQRAHYYGDFPSVRMPESFKEKFINMCYWGDNQQTVASVAEHYEELCEHAAQFYRKACEADISYQDARFGLLEGTTSYILWEGSLREFINTYAYRACSMFQWEIVAVFRKMKEVLVEAHPYLASYIKISCEKTHGSLDPVTEAGGTTEENYAHHCTFQGWEEVEPQCDFPWARESNRIFRSDHHRIEKTA